jgi:two-component sensor histidine kinase
MSLLAGLAAMGSAAAGAAKNYSSKDKKPKTTSNNESYTPTSSTSSSSKTTPSVSPLGAGLLTLGSVAAPIMGGFIKGSVNQGGGTGGVGTTSQPQAQGSSYMPLGTYNDYELQKYNPTAYSQIEAAKQDYLKAYEAQNQAGMDEAHARAEAIRNQYGNYSGGVDGSEYNPYQQTQQQAPQQVVQQSAVDVGNVMDSVRDIGRQYAQQSDEHAAAVAAQYTQMVGLLDQLEAQIVGQIRSQMNGDDPGLQAAIGVIKEEAARMRDEALEDLNARGLVQSGVYAESLSRLQKNELTSIQQTIAGQFNDLQTQLNNALMSMAQARVSALSGSQSQLNSMLQADRATQAQLGMQGVGYGLEERGQNLQDKQYYAGLQNQWGIANMQNQTDLYGMNLGAETDRYKTDKSWDIANMQNQTDIYGIDKSYAASIYGANKSGSGSGSSTAADRLAFDMEMFEYDKQQQEAAIKESQYQQMGLMLDDLIANTDYDYNQKIALINNSRYPEDVKQWAILQLNTIQPQVVEPEPLKNVDHFPLINNPWTPPSASEISGDRRKGSNSRRISWTK